MALPALTRPDFLELQVSFPEFWSLKILGKINQAMNTTFSLSHRRVLPYRLQDSLVLFLGQWFSKCEPRTSSISISWGLVRNPNSWDLLQSDHQKLGEGPSNVLSQALHVMLIPTTVRDPLFRLTLGTLKWRGQGQMCHS